MSNARNISKADSRFVNATGDTISGDVGIGTSPATSLEVSNATPNAAKLRVSRSTTQTNHLELGTSGGSSTLTAQGISGISGDFLFLTKPSDGSATMRMQIDGAGRITTPHQPAFKASFNITTPTAYVTGSRILDFTTVVHNVGGHYDGTNRFTAPVAGIYRFSCDRALNTQGQDQVIRHPGMSFFKNGVSVHGVNPAVSAGAVGSTTSYMHFVVNMGTELYLNANDYVQVSFNYTNSPHTLYEYATNYFSGYLVG